MSSSSQPSQRPFKDMGKGKKKQRKGKVFLTKLPAKCQKEVKNSICAGSSFRETWLNFCQRTQIQHDDSEALSARSHLASTLFVLPQMASELDARPGIVSSRSSTKP